MGACSGSNGGGQQLATIYRSLSTCIELSYLRIGAEVRSRVMSGEDESLLPLLSHQHLWFVQVPRVLDDNLLVGEDELAEWRFDTEEQDDDGYNEMTRLTRSESPSYDGRHLAKLRHSPDARLAIFETDKHPDVTEA